MISNTQKLLDDILKRQQKKFGNTSVEELRRKLEGEIAEWQEAIRIHYIAGGNNKQLAYNIKLEEADIIIIANRLYQEFNDMLAFAILSKFYNYETAEYVKIKWDIVEKRPYEKKQGQWQHINYKTGEKF